MSWKAPGDGGWATKMTRQQQAVIAKAKKAAKEAETAAHAAKEAEAALKAAASKGKAKSHGKGKGTGKASGWYCEDLDCLKHLQKASPKRGPYYNAENVKQCQNCWGFRGSSAAVATAQRQTEREELRAMVAAKNASTATADSATKPFDVRRQR